MSLIAELSKTELKALAEKNSVELPSNAKHGEMVEILTQALGSEEIEDAPLEDAPEESDVVETETEESVEEIEDAPRIDGEYVVKSNLKRNGEFYPKGTTIHVESDEAMQLLAEGVIE